MTGFDERRASTDGALLLEFEVCVEGLEPLAKTGFAEDVIAGEFDCVVVGGRGVVFVGAEADAAVGVFCVGGCDTPT